MRTLTFTVPMDYPRDPKQLKSLKDYLRAIKPQLGEEWGAKGQTLGLGFLWYTNRVKTLNRELPSARKQLIWGLMAVHAISVDVGDGGKGKYIYNLEQRFKPCFGGLPTGTIVLREE